MQPSLPHQLYPLAAAPGLALATVSGAAGYLFWLMLVGICELVAVVRVLRHPVENWPHRHWSTLGWVLASLCLAPALGGYPIPVGAIATIWRTVRRPAGPTTYYGIPMHEGSPEFRLPLDDK